MEKLEEIKQQISADLKKVEDAVNYSSLSNLRADLAKVVADTRENAEKHLNALEQANERADEALDPWIEKAQHSRFTLLYVAFLLATGAAVGVVIGINL